MQSKQENKMSREEIIYYVDNLIEANKESYDKRLSPLLYEFFLRANEKFEWSREYFLEKYQNFKNNVKEIKITDMKKVGMPSFWSGGFSYGEKNKGIYINKKHVRNVKKKPTKENIDDIIDDLFHECLHATDLTKENEKIKKYGLYHIGDNDEGDTMLNEYANVLSTILISSDKAMYTDNCGIDFTNNGSYSSLKCPGEIMCAALDITEPQLARFKDKGGNLFYEYLQNKFPYTNIKLTVDVFKSSLNVIYNATMSRDKENISLGLKTLIDAACFLILNRLENTLNQSSDRKETLERIYYDIYKCGEIVKSVDRIYGLNGNNKVFNKDILSIGINLVEKVKIYNRFLDNEELFTQEEKEKIQNGGNAKEIIESKFDDNYIDSEFDIEEIVGKYYSQSNEPLNDNAELIKYIKGTMLKLTGKEKFQNVINKVRNIKIKNQIKVLPLPKVQERCAANKQKSANFRNSVKYELKIEHKINKDKENEDISRNNEESTR